MNPARSSIGGGIVATVVLAVFLLITDFLLSGTKIFVFATFTSLCAIGGPPYCEAGSLTAAGLTFFWFIILFALGWPLLFGGFTWGLPGESGLTHGAVFGFILWIGYVVTVLYGIWAGGETFAEDLPLLIITLFAYLVYGLVLGGVYDHFAGHRTFLTRRTDRETMG
ncbi:DUF6789 family protein [Halocatena marina]|uniref:DUF6789 family protein n=1 Tax=Halocatena marina TaxID=2934937 RepID=UPI002010B3E8|nr:DUF6789 family protein [Halocatena marina]